MLYQMASWAKRNKQLARGIVIITSALLILIAHQLGLYLFAQELLLPWEFGLCCLALTAFVRYQLLKIKDRRAEYSKKEYFQQYKFRLGVLYAGLFVCSLYMGNYTLASNISIFPTQSQQVATGPMQLSVFYYPVQPSKNKKKRKRNWFKKQLKK